MAATGRRGETPIGRAKRAVRQSDAGCHQAAFNDVAAMHDHRDTTDFLGKKGGLTDNCQSAWFVPG
jgi:hypothetical protein